ncbi:MAG: sulfatase-like hydrolase/transferase [Opitutaceae bacterium]|nr:sulfatase-like hydrolase/transferase [Opitutaceae bacterium]
MEKKPAPESRPNVLVITVDQWPGSFLGCAGHPQIQTPTIDALARAGTRFTNAYSETPVCIPARRTLMTGVPPRRHGDRAFNETLPLPPDLPTLAGTFRAAGYQAYASGKLHVYPVRARIGFDDVALCEEGRVQFGTTDDYEESLARAGYPGEAFYHGLSVNGYETRSWHLPERHHMTNWTTEQMIRYIKRRDPSRPSFWYLSYNGPHPPIAPPADFRRLYDGVTPPAPPVGAWARDDDRLPGLVLEARHRFFHPRPDTFAEALRAYYAVCTHVDNQLRLVIGTLREEGLLANTVILLTADHGDMLGQHGCWAKRLYYERSARVPMILVGANQDPRVALNATDDRLAGLQDVMPTVLTLAGVPVPRGVTGLPLTGAKRRDYLFGEINHGIAASRMIREGDLKLIYYPEGNLFQLFDVARDPDELEDLASDPAHRAALRRLQGRLRDELHGDDVKWRRGAKWVGLPRRETAAVVRALDARAHHLVNQRGSHFPLPPKRA